MKIFKTKIYFINNVFLNKTDKCDNHWQRKVFIAPSDIKVFPWALCIQVNFVLCAFVYMRVCMYVDIMSVHITSVSSAAITLYSPHLLRFFSFLAPRLNLMRCLLTKKQSLSIHSSQDRLACLRYYMMHLFLHCSWRKS